MVFGLLDEAIKAKSSGDGNQFSVIGPGRYWATIKKIAGQVGDKGEGNPVFDKNAFFL